MDETWRTQLSCTTGFVTLHRWARILERHFPPEPPDPDHATSTQVLTIAKPQNRDHCAPRPTWR
jgi:hypothetical protein